MTVTTAIAWGTTLNSLMGVISEKIALSDLWATMRTPLIRAILKGLV